MRERDHMGMGLTTINIQLLFRQKSPAHGH